MGNPDNIYTGDAERDSMPTDEYEIYGIWICAEDLDIYAESNNDDNEVNAAITNISETFVSEINIEVWYKNVTGIQGRYRHQ